MTSRGHLKPKQLRSYNNLWLSVKGTKNVRPICTFVLYTIRLYFNHPLGTLDIYHYVCKPFIFINVLLQILLH